MADGCLANKLERGRGKSQPLYLQVKQHLHKQIESGKLSVGERLPAIAQIVNGFEVDYKTVGFALDLLEDDGLIRREPGRGKGAVVVRSTNVRCTCSIAFPRWSGSAQFVAIAEGIEEFAEKNKIKVIATDAMQNNRRYLDMVTHAPPDVDGLILYPWDTPEYHQAVSDAVESGLKIVFIDRVIPNIDVSSVSIDHFRGAYQATTHLIKTHNCPVYYVGQPRRPSSARQRYEGWLEAMHEYNYRSKHSKYVWELPKSEAETVDMPIIERQQIISEKILHLFETTKESKYCIFCVNDDIAACVYQAAQKAGLQIGKDVYVAGFGDKPYCENLPVPLTSVFQADKEVGYEAARLLYDNIKGFQRRSVHKIIPVKLKIRASSTGEF